MPAFFKLDQHQSNKTSQYGEDGLIAYLIGVIPNISKTCCEFGAGDGITLSNTNALWTEQGWKALLIEGNEAKHRKSVERFGHYKNATFVCEMIAIRGDYSLDAIAKANGFGPDIGIVSIDIDSIDYHVFRTLEYVRPQLAIIEFNNHIPPQIDYADDEGQVFLRCSAKALERIGKEKGYRAVACTTTNIFLVREDMITDANRHLFPDAPIEYLFDYDGQVRNGTNPRFHVPSQLVSIYPVFSGEVSAWRWAARWVKSVSRKALRGEPERMGPPSAANRANLRRAGLWTL